MNSHKVIEYQHGSDLISVTVHSANGFIGSERDLIRFDQSEIEKSIKPPNKSRFILRVVTYPDCIASSDVTINGERVTPDFDTFANWPDEFTRQWSDAVGELNPHWLDPEYNKKKVTT